MGYNKSLDFLNMIKNGESALGKNVFPKEDALHEKEPLQKSLNVFGLQEEQQSPEIQEEQKKHQTREKQTSHNKTAASSSAASFAVIDTETNWHDQVMSLGVAIADKTTFKCLETRYYIFEQEARVGGMYSNVLYKSPNAISPITATRATAMADLTDFLNSHHITSIYAYNAKFDCGHLPELKNFAWYDIMRIAAYKQFNRSIPDTAPCCKTGRLKSNYGVEPITRMLTGNSRYYEVHNAVADAVDELRIVELLGLPIATYDIARINS